MGPSKGDEKILSYNDVVLRRSDLDILSGPYFLNDRVIEFYFSYLSSKCSSQDILLVPPSISFWITNCPDPASLRDFVDPLQLPRRELIIFTVNDNDDVGLAEGGSHWSLLAYDRNLNVFVHHDSMKGLNGWHAKKLYNAVAGYVFGNDSGSAPRFHQSPTPQQENGYDCGLYVLDIAKVICDRYEAKCPEGGDQWFSAVRESVDGASVRKLRSEILQLVQGFMNGV